VTTQRNILTATVIYGAVAFTLIGGIGISLATIVTAVKSAPVVQAKTPLQVQIESAREVREALARPVLAPDPLPPITAKLERKLEKPVLKVAARPAPQRNREYAMRQAHQAFANMGPPTPPPFFGFMAFDRHAMR
jgi:hypothetical protein